MDVKYCGITILSSKKRHADALRRTLRYLRRIEPPTFRRVARHLKTIIIVPRRGYSNETFVRQKLWITESSILNDLTSVPRYLSSLLLHEAHHIAQFRASKPYRGAAAEREAYRVQRTFLKRIGEENAVQWLDAQYRSQWWRTMDRNPTAHSKFARHLRKLRPTLAQNANSATF
jgi:hypothetical protein